MTRLLLSFCSTACLLAWLPPLGALAAEMPARKAGLWEMKQTMVGPPPFELTTQECTDGTIEKTMSTASAPAEEEVCSRRDIEKTKTGYVIDSVRNFGRLSITRHSELIGDLDSGYVEKSTSRSQHGPSHAPREETATTEAKWLGACKPDQKPGDIVMPGGLKMNINDARKRDGKLYLRLK